MNCSVGDNIIVELRNGDIIECKVKHLSANTLEGKNVIINASGFNIGSMVFYKMDIVSIKIVNSLNLSENDTPSQSKDDIADVACINLEKEEFVRLRECIKNYQYHASMDNNYLKALQYLEACETIGLVIIKTDLDRSVPISMIAIAAWDEVHIFDIKMYNMKLFPNEIRIILQNDCIKKVVHDSRMILDTFKTYYNINFKNVFDLKITDAFVNTKLNKEVQHTTKTLSECLQHYINFPASIITKDFPLKTWATRPLNDDLKAYISQQVGYLITLKNKMEVLLLKDLYDLIDIENKSIMDMTPVQALGSLKLNNLTECTQVALKGMIS